MNFIRAIFKWIDRITAWIAVLSLVLMFFFVFLNVVTRYILGTGFAWSEEGARYAMMAVIILGVLEVTHQRDHFAVDLLTNVAPKPVRRLMNIFADIMMLVIMYVMTFGSYQMVVLNWENRTPAIGLPSWLPYGLLLFSSAISILYWKRTTPKKGALLNANFIFSHSICAAPSRGSCSILLGHQRDCTDGISRPVFFPADCSAIRWRHK